MFERFQSEFDDGVHRQKAAGGSRLIEAEPGLGDLLSRFGGMSCRNGLYRVILAEDVRPWNDRIALAFPAFAASVTCFGYDWLGRAFALDARRVEDGMAGVVMLEPGTGEALEIPANLETFHDQELIEFTDAAVAESFYQSWLHAGGAAPRYDQCVGYRKPLFLNGPDDLTNLELSDLDVYWHVIGQLIQQTKGLPEGSRVAAKIA